jgi:diguanylate cyclase (GGDEF)-like protein
MSEPVDLKEVEILADLGPDEMKGISRCLHRRRLKERQVLFHEGDEGRELYIVESGRLGVSVRTEDGADLDIAEFGPGDFFGEMSIFEQEPRSATCYTKTESVLQSLHETDLLSLIENDPIPAMKVMLRMLSITRSRLDNTGSFLTEMVQWGEAARKRSITDELTGFFNRRYLDEALPSLLSSSRDEKRQLSFCMLDLDHFRQINEQISHAVGDEVIQKTAAVMREVLLPTDIPVRHGGDEFVILMPGTAPKEGAARADVFRKKLNSQDLLKDYDCSVKKVTTSIGIACYPDHARNVARLKEVADQALYRAKESGRNRVSMYTKEAE